ncbi:hypothetical protein CONCODRAFT_14039 [Conidiobolus coronatus NRRL 28638]|uniref:Transposase Tc1-like domain-containing protein n=1 Tax=Conidiobolus coronatus (strain ATCC 28846 / CBS 209.66 / NRRL 28638) TaxID=796925 RepID=A0A137NPR0_CONC2|nr:hypothetical protein CONCODRAFT_14039 [Conidiobolus coronatus NRRL 28638]|eukprot:KXN64724.1 hypothetical protein CONCODRAFT_14039 [Conidiobolus coronatus NRRL 28638]
MTAIYPISQKGYIHIYLLLNKTAYKAHKKLKRALGDNEYSKSQVYAIYKMLKKGRTSFEHLPKKGCPSISKNKKSINKVEKYLVQYPFSSLRDILSALNIIREAVRYIIKTKLRLIKKNTKWIPNTLTSAQKATRIAIALKNISLDA